MECNRALATEDILSHEASGKATRRKRARRTDLSGKRHPQVMDLNE
jgi:hypothetical protein